MEELTNRQHINSSHIPIALSQINDSIDLSLRMAAVFYKNFHKLGVNLSIKTEILYLIIFVKIDIRIGKTCWIYLCQLEPFWTQIVDNLLEVVKYKQVWIVFYQYLY